MDASHLQASCALVLMENIVTYFVCLDPLVSQSVSDFENFL